MKKSINKLALNKTTISNLSTNELSARVGGAKTNYYCTLGCTFGYDCPTKYLGCTVVIK